MQSREADIAEAEAELFTCDEFTERAPLSSSLALEEQQ